MDVPWNTELIITICLWFSFTNFPMCFEPKKVDVVVVDAATICKLYPMLCLLLFFKFSSFSDYYNLTHASATSATTTTETQLC